MIRCQGLGVDILSLDRARRFVRAQQKGLKSFLLASEYALWRRSRMSALAFALIFCAKEAASKAAGVSLRSPGDFKDWKIGLLRGRLTVRYHGTRIKRLKSLRFAAGAFRQRQHAGILCVAYRRFAHPKKQTLVE